MLATLLALLVALPLSAPFGEATATATSFDGGLAIDVSVEVRGAPVAVVVRGLGPGDSELPPVALADRGNGRWEGIVQLPVVENILIGFESIPATGPTTMSDFHTLTELGVDQAVFSLDNPDSGFGEDDSSLVTPEGARWGWLAVAAGTAALGMLALWVLRSRDGDDEETLSSDPSPLQTD